LKLSMILNERQGLHNLSDVYNCIKALYIMFNGSFGLSLLRVYTKQFMEINNFFLFIHKFVNVVYEKNNL